MHKIFTMALREILIILALTTLVCSTETDDIEHNKRGAGKTTSVNTIPTGIQKPEYTYSIYSQNSNAQGSLPNQKYQVQVPNSFYPNQASSQYYTSSGTNNDGTVTHSNPPQVNVAPHQSSSQFLPLNFVPRPGYQAKYQIVPPKSTNGNIQLAFLQQSPGFSTSNLHLPQTVYTQPTNQINSHGNPLFSPVSPHGHFNFATNYQPLSLNSPYLGQQHTVLLPQFNSPFYNHLLYSTPGHNFYYPTNSQPKSTYSQTSQSSTSNEYDKLQSHASQSSSKEENDIAAQSSELIQSDSIPGYKSTYNSGRSLRYTKLK